MVFIQSLKDRAKGYITPLTEVALQVANYQTIAFLPKVKPKDDKDSKLERAVKDIKETSDRRFVIDGLVVEPFKPQYSSETDYFRASALVAGKDYILNKNTKSLNEEDLPLHLEIEERIRDSKYRNMGIPFGTGKQFSAKKNEFWNNVLSKMGSYFALTSVCYSFA